jgi:probable F420-dependent oxidoreductase
VGAVKVRIGFGPGRAGLAPRDLPGVVDAMTDHGLDSLWLSEQLTGDVIDPLVGLAFAASHNRRLKLGTTMLLPGRNVMRLAKELATLDALSEGRLLVTFVPGVVRSPEREAIGVAPRARAAVIDEVLPLLRRLLNGEVVDHESPIATLREVRLSPLPVQQPLEFWLGGMAAASLDRCGRMGDGWLPSFCSPEDAVAGRGVIEEAAASAGRVISPEHFGVSLGYSTVPLADAEMARARGGRSGPPVPQSLGELRATLEAFIEVGFSKFVVRPVSLRSTWREEIAALAAAVGDLQT